MCSGDMKGALRRPRSPGAVWGSRIDLGFDDRGKRRQRQVGNAATKRDAQAALNEALAGLQQGTYVAPSSGRGSTSASRCTVSGTRSSRLDAGVPFRDVQEAASHADPRTTMGDDRARRSIDRHAPYIVSTFIAGATRPG
jgi:hypothetical protein